MTWYIHELQKCLKMGVNNTKSFFDKCTLTLCIIPIRNKVTIRNKSLFYTSKNTFHLSLFVVHQYKQYQRSDNWFAIKETVAPNSFHRSRKYCL